MCRFCRVIKITVWRIGVGSNSLAEPFPEFGHFLFYCFIFNPSTRCCLCRDLGAGQATAGQVIPAETPSPGLPGLRAGTREPAGQTPAVGGSGTAGEGSWVVSCRPPPCPSTSEARDPIPSPDSVCQDRQTC